MQPLLKEDKRAHERILVIADIHGGYQALMALLTELQPGQNDLLVTLGDYVDRGPDANEVLAELRNCAEVLNTVLLRGNHETMFLMAMARAPAIPDMYDDSIACTTEALADNLNVWLLNGGLNTLDAYCRAAGRAAQRSLAALEKAARTVYFLEKDRISIEHTLIRHCTELAAIIPPEDLLFMRDTCADILVTGQHILVHGGYDPQFLPQAQQLSTLHWGYPSQACTTMHKTLVVGHQILRNRLPRFNGSLLHLDTGSTCAADGRLTCMDLLTLQFWQADQRGRICHHGKLSP